MSVVTVGFGPQTTHSGFFRSLTSRKLMPSASTSSSRPTSGCARSEDELDRLRRLDHAEQARQDAEHAAFRARRNAPGGGGSG